MVYVNSLTSIPFRAKSHGTTQKKLLVSWSSLVCDWMLEFYCSICYFHWLSFRKNAHSHRWRYFFSISISFNSDKIKYCMNFSFISAFSIFIYMSDEYENIATCSTGFFLLYQMFILQRPHILLRLINRKKNMVTMHFVNLVELSWIKPWLRKLNANQKRSRYILIYFGRWNFPLLFALLCAIFIFLYQGQYLRFDWNRIIVASSINYWVIDCFCHGFYVMQISKGFAFHWQIPMALESKSQRNSSSFKWNGDKVKRTNALLSTVPQEWEQCYCIERKFAKNGIFWWSNNKKPQKKKIKPKPK